MAPGRRWGHSEPSYNVPGNIPQWRENVLDRAKNKFRDVEESYKYFILVSRK